MQFSFPRAHRHAVAFGVGFGLLCAVEGRARATPPGGDALAEARQAWDGGEFDRAERSYEQALQRGGLDKAATLECYIHLGATRAVLGKKEGAVIAFRTALLIDDHFSVPPEAGKKAVVLAQTVRRQASHVGMLHVQVSVPDEVSSGRSFVVDASLDAAQIAFVTKLALRVKDVTTKKTWRQEEPVDTTVIHFNVPASMTLPRASLRLQVDALDEHGNQLAFEEAHTTVLGAMTGEDHLATRHDRDETKSGGFWSSPWPYVLGGIVLAAGAATGVYFLLKPPDQVSIGPVQVQTY